MPGNLPHKFWELGVSVRHRVMNW